MLKTQLLGDRHVFSNQLYKQYFNVLLAICLMSSFSFFFGLSWFHILGEWKEQEG